ncbi:unnamed protein product [Bursaphelenchus okinawaensis]|uniref:CRAL-TRIO domain-containing protein n=1 Tax=Bursaphelenchus okinawaensis TaxID=465554 RepID=A0A811LS20_9BILA|nr:unnamed protein product [Bursaphelenchus okinawaensis]CAG9127105.1 unnamed protein product [Bursaphelenchus okinawaensis]
MTISQLNPDELKKVNQLRKLVSEELKPGDYYNTDFNLLRWIQGNCHDSLEEVAKKLKTHLKMRKSCWNLDEMARKPRKHPIHNHWRYGITSESKVLSNVIVNIEQCGETDYSGMIETYSIQEVMKARCQDLEDLLAEVMEMEAKTGRQASVLYIMDLTGLQYNTRLYTLVTGAMRALSEFMAHHYVELIKYFLLVNVPSFIYTIWMVAKPLIPERTRHKVRILSSHGWREELLEYSCVEALPTKWNTDTITHFEANVDLPVPYPVENYYRNCPKVVKDLEKIRLAARKTQLITKELKKGDMLSWFVSADADFGFGVYFTKHREEKNLENMSTVYPCLEWMPGPSESPLDGEVEAPEDGYYRIWMSNERAWWHTLSLQCKFGVNENV